VIVHDTALDKKIHGLRKKGPLAGRGFSGYSEEQKENRTVKNDTPRIGQNLMNE